MTSKTSTESQRPPAQNRSWLAVFAVIATYGGVIGSQTVGALLFSLYASLQDWSSARTEGAIQSTVGMFAFLVISEVLLIALLLSLMLALRWSRSSIGLVRPRVRHLLGGLAAAVPYYLVLIVLLWVLSRFVPGLDTEQQQDVGFNDVVGSMDMLLTFLALVIIVPIAEEITFRGFLYRGVRPLLPKAIAALVVSIVFASMHLFGGENDSLIWIAAIDTFLLSLVLIWLREKTGSLWSGISLHATKNFLAFLALYVFSVG